MNARSSYIDTGLHRFLPNVRADSISEITLRDSDSRKQIPEGHELVTFEEEFVLIMERSGLEAPPGVLDATDLPHSAEVGNVLHLAADAGRRSIVIGSRYDITVNEVINCLPPRLRLLYMGGRPDARGKAFFSAYIFMAIAIPFFIIALDIPSAAPLLIKRRRISP